MTTVFSTNINVFTAEDVTALRHRVVSWGWRQPSIPLHRQRQAMLDETRRSLRRFPDADKIARAYHSHKVLLDEGPRHAIWKAFRWTIRAVEASDRVLVAAPPGGADRLLWMAAYVTARLMQKPIYVYSEVWIEPHGRRNWSTRWLQRSLRRGGHRLLVPGQLHRDYLLHAGVERARIEVIESIYCPKVPPRRLLPVRAGQENHTLTLLYVGRLIPVKGLERLLHIVARLVQTGFSFRVVVIAGRPTQYMGSDSGYAERCRELIDALPAGRVTLLEHVDCIERTYKRADMLVMPNVIVTRDKVPAEAWGRVVEEALLYDLPVVGTDAVPAVLESVVDGVNGHVVPWGCDDALEAALAGVIAGARTG